MNLFVQTFALLHKNMKIAFVITIPMLIGSILGLMAEGHRELGLFIELAVIVVGIITAVVSIGWANEAVLTGQAVKPWREYTKFVWKYILLGIIQFFVFFMVAIGFVNQWMSKFPAEEHWKDSEVIFSFFSESATSLIWFSVINIVLIIIFVLSSYILVIDDKGVWYAIKQSFKYSFKGFLKGFISGVSMILLLGAIAIALGILTFYSNPLLEVVITAFAGYASALFTVFMVSLYHKLKSA